jgi:hypothetical protein
MASHRRIRFMAAVVVGMAVMTLTTPRESRAAPTLFRCGVCTTAFECPDAQTRQEQCNAICDTYVASECLGGIPGGWTCNGGGVYTDSWECG